jgi:YD repeat-containing protein
MRRLKEVDDGGRVEYTYNAAGSLTEIHVIDRNGTIGGQRLTLDEDQRVTFIERLTGGETHLTYDRLGNVTSVTTGDKTTRYTYDRLNRLMDIVTPDGKWLQYRYRDGEPDLRLQMDHHTGRTVSERITTGITFSSGPELLKNRTEISAFGVVRFDRAMMDYRLSSEHGVVFRDAVAVSAVERIRVREVGASGDKEKQVFDAPSNVMFIPAEYGAVNCCPECPFGDDTCHFLCDLDGGGGGGGCPYKAVGAGTKTCAYWCTSGGGTKVESGYWITWTCDDDVCVDVGAAYNCSIVGVACSATQSCGGNTPVCTGTRGSEWSCSV